MNRPTTVTVFGVLNIVFGVIGIFGSAASAAMYFLPHADANNPVLKIMHDNAAYAAFMKVSVVLGLVVSVVLLAAGIGLLMLKPWARGLSLAYAIYAIVAGLIGIGLNFVYLVGPLLEQARHAQGPEAAGAVGGVIGGTVGGCFGFIYPILLLIFLTRPKVVAAFRPVDATLM